MNYSIASTLGELLDNEQTQNILEQHIPGISTHPQISMGRGYPFTTVVQYSGGLITDEMLATVDAALTALA